MSKQGCATLSQIIGLTASFVTGLGALASDAGDAIQLHSFQTHSRMNLRIDEGIPAEFQNNAQGFRIVLKGIGLVDLGAPMGDEDRWKALYRGVENTQVGSLEFSENTSGVVLSGRWKFPQGKSSLAEPAMETFVYRQKTPPRFVVDFWLKKGPTKIEAEAIKKEIQHIASLKKTREDAQKRIDRRIAYDRYRAEVANVSNFCDKPVNESNDVFLEFRALHEKFNFQKWLLRATADEGFHYFKPTSTEKEAQYVRLALELYSKENPGLAIRTLDFLKEEFPHSTYLLQMEFLRANCLIKLGLQAAADETLNKLITAHRTSPVALHSVMYLVGRQMAESATHQAIQGFLWLVQNYPHHELNWLFHLGVAECLYSQGDSEQAIKEYRWVMEHAPNDLKKAEGAYRLGDVYHRRHQYSQSLAAYFMAIQKFPKQVGLFPTFHLNRGETLYQLKQYGRAETIYQKFLEDFSGHPQGWRATLRLAEIYGRQSTPAQREAQRQWYYETINRHPLSPGATVARLRLLPCGNHGGFDLKSAQRFFSRAQNFDGEGEILPKGYSDLLALARVRSLITMSTQDDTALGALDELQNVKSTTVRQILVTIANDFFQKMIMRLLDEGHTYEALAYYSSVAPKIPDVETVTDIDYLLRLSQSAADLGLGGFASKLYDTYSKKLQKNEVSGKKIVTIGLDSESNQFESEIRTSEKIFTEAKALYVFEIERNGSDFKKIKEMLLKVKDESKFSTLKEIILGLINHKEGQIDEAIQHLTRAQLTGDYLNVDSLLAKIELSRGNQEVAQNILENLEKKVILRNASKFGTEVKQRAALNEQIGKSLGLPDVPDLKSILLSIAEILEKQKKWTKLVAVYDRAIQYGLKAPLIQYAYAQALFRQGDAESDASITEKAKKVLEDLVQSKNNESSESADASDPEKRKFWKTLAAENLANVKSIGKFIATAKEGTK